MLVQLPPRNVVISFDYDRAGGSSFPQCGFTVVQGAHRRVEVTLAMWRCDSVPTRFGTPISDAEILARIDWRASGVEEGL